MLVKPSRYKSHFITIAVVLIIFLGAVFFFPQIKTFTESLLGKSVNLFTAGIALDQAYKETIPVECSAVVLAPERLGELSDEAVLEKLYLSGQKLRLQLRGITKETETTRTHVIYKEDTMWSWEEGKTEGTKTSGEGSLPKLLSAYTNQDIIRLDCVKDTKESERFIVPADVTFTDNQSKFFQKLRDATRQ